MTFTLSLPWIISLSVFGVIMLIGIIVSIHDKDWYNMIGATIASVIFSAIVLGAASFLCHISDSDEWAKLREQKSAQKAAQIISELPFKWQQFAEAVINETSPSLRIHIVSQLRELDPPQLTCEQYRHMVTKICNGLDEATTSFVTKSVLPFVNVMDELFPQEPAQKEGDGDDEIDNHEIGDLVE